jgi:hypothetical protein
VKYIIVTECDMEVAILFDALLKHKQIAAGRKVISAGFVKFESKKIAGDGTDKWESTGIVVYGGSDSLGINSRPQDLAIIKESMERQLVC